MKTLFDHITPLAAGLILTAAPALAQADETWLLNAQGTATRSAHVPSIEYFQPGAAAGLGVYRSLTPHFQVGGRLSGLLVPEDEPAAGFEHEGDLAVGAMTAMMRVRPLADPFEESRDTGLYIEAGGGPALVGTEVSGAVDVGLGWNFEVADAVAFGPNVRYLQAFESDDRFVGEDARVWMAGLEMSFLGDVAPPVRPVAEAGPDIQVTVNVPERDAQRFADTDGDRVSDRWDHCPMDRETFNRVDDHDGCPDQGEVDLTDNRLVIDEAVFFAYDDASLTEEGRATLLEVATAYHDAERPWRTLILKGHADRQGPAGYNAELSLARAETVEGALTDMGVPADIIQIEAYGEYDPQVRSEKPLARNLNRRVEFVVLR